MTINQLKQYEEPMPMPRKILIEEFKCVQEVVEKDQKTSLSFPEGVINLLNLTLMPILLHINPV